MRWDPFLNNNGIIYVNYKVQGSNSQNIWRIPYKISGFLGKIGHFVILKAVAEISEYDIIKYWIRSNFGCRNLDTFLL